MCPPLFSEETIFDSILVSDLLRKQPPQLGILGGHLREVRLVLQRSFNIKTGDIYDSLIREWPVYENEAEKGQNNRFTYTSPCELRKWVWQNFNFICSV